MDELQRPRALCSQRGEGWRLLLQNLYYNLLEKVLLTSRPCLVERWGVLAAAPMVAPGLPGSMGASSRDPRHATWSHKGTALSTGTLVRSVFRGQGLALPALPPRHPGP